MNIEYLYVIKDGNYAILKEGQDFPPILLLKFTNKFGFFKFLIYLKSSESLYFHKIDKIKLWMGSTKILRIQIGRIVKCTFKCIVLLYSNTKLMADLWLFF